jgi:hypothetical protein
MEAIAALTPYRAGKLTAEQMSLIAAVVNAAPASPKVEAAQAILKPFFGERPPTQQQAAA